MRIHFPEVFQKYIFQDIGLIKYFKVFKSFIGYLQYSKHTYSTRIIIQKQLKSKYNF